MAQFEKDKGFMVWDHEPIEIPLRMYTRKGKAAKEVASAIQKENKDFVFNLPQILVKDIHPLPVPLPIEIKQDNKPNHKTDESEYVPSKLVSPSIKVDERYLFHGITIEMASFAVLLIMLLIMIFK